MWPYGYESYKMLHGDVSDCVRKGCKKNNVSSYYPTVHFLWYVVILNYMNCGSSVNLLAVGFIICLVLGGDRDISNCYFVACDSGSPGLLPGTGIVYTSE